MKPLQELVRKNIWDLQPYSSARDEFHGDASVFLDANENPWNAPYNRYPDPMQRVLKDRISALKRIAPDHVFVGNGSDEAIDLILRTFCEPGTDNMVTISPSYGMYEVAANTNNVKCVKVLLDTDFQLDPEAVLDAVDAQTKVIFLCSPNNPSGNLLRKDALCRVLDCFSGIVVIDEAYIDFAAEASFLGELDRYPNLIVLQTLSKAWGAAGIRLGMAFASPEIIAILNKVKYPYNVNQLTQEQALRILQNTDLMQQQLQQILTERDRIGTILSESPFYFKVYPSDANFLLVEVGEADAMYHYLTDWGVVVRNRTRITLCEGCLRITIGTPKENDKLLHVLRTYVATHDH